jgi:hypothetical protein
MAKPKAETPQDEKVEKPEEKAFEISKDSMIDVSVTVISQDGDPYHETGAEFEVGKKTAKELEARGWVKLKK